MLLFESTAARQRALLPRAISDSAAVQASLKFRGFAFSLLARVYDADDVTLLTSWRGFHAGPVIPPSKPLRCQCAAHFKAA